MGVSGVRIMGMLASDRNQRRAEIVMSPDPHPSGAAPHAAQGGWRHGRWGLYAPFLLLGLVVAGWSAYWVIARGVVVTGLERAVAEAAAHGEVWTCRDRQVSGYPFRIEVRCAEVTLSRQASAGVVEASLGGVVAVGQPQTPSHIVFEAVGPLALRFAGGARATAEWERAQGSHRQTGGELERVSLALTRPVFSVAGMGPKVTTVSAATGELHIRRHPTRAPEEGARDLFVRLAQLASGDLDAVFGDANPSDIELQAVVSRAGVLGQGVTPAALEAWRLQGGQGELTRFALTKGLKRIEAQGVLGLDAERRLTGRIEPSIANIDQIGGVRLRGGALDLAGALSGRPPPASADGLRPLPAIDLRGGRLSLGPIRLPAPAFGPLY
jgi:hypothetical protein